MTIKAQKNLEVKGLETVARIEKYRSLNEAGSPMLDGMSFFDMGVFLLFVEMMGEHSTAPNLGNLLSVTKLTCKNWIKKHNKDSVAQVDWVSVGRGHYQISDWGIYCRECFDPFIPFVQATIDRWLEQRNDSR